MAACMVGCILTSRLRLLQDGTSTGPAELIKEGQRMQTWGLSFPDGVVMPVTVEDNQA